MEQEPINKSTIDPLAEAVEQGNVDAVRELLIGGRNTEDYEKDGKIEGSTLMNLALAGSHVEIMKLLFSYGAVVEFDFLTNVFKMENSDHVLELVSYFIEFGNNDDDNQLIMNIFVILLKSNFEGSTALEVLKLLLNNGLDGHYFFDEVLPILNYCVSKNRTDFVRY